MMKEIFKEIEGDKLLLIVINSIFENDAILNASYKYTDKCFINIEPKDNSTEVFFQRKEENINLEEIALAFGNELIDQQVRKNVEKEFKFVREQLLTKAFTSISK